MPAVTAASTRMHSKPSRKTRTPISRTAAVGYEWGARGSGFPLELNPSQISTAARANPPIQRAAKKNVLKPNPLHFKMQVNVNEDVPSCHSPGIRVITTCKCEYLERVSRAWSTAVENEVMDKNT